MQSKDCASIVVRTFDARDPVPALKTSKALHAHVNLHDSEET